MDALSLHHLRWSRTIVFAEKWVTLFFVTLFAMEWTGCSAFAWVITTIAFALFFVCYIRFLKMESHLVPSTRINVAFSL